VPQASTLPRPSAYRRSAATGMTKAQQNARSRSPLEELFDGFPRGLALLELDDLNDVSTWRLAAINDLASNIVPPSIETFTSSKHLGVRASADLPAVYREVVRDRRPRAIGMIGPRGLVHGPGWLHMITAYPVGEHGVAILFDDVHSLFTERSARAHAEHQIAQTCEFMGAIVWRAEPDTLQFTYVSPHAKAILGYWQERWTGEVNFWKKHLFPDDRERVAAMCDKIVRERKRGDFEFRMISVHGQILWFHAAAEFVDHGKRPELVGVMNDITDLKRAEERIRALTARIMRLQDDERRRISRELHDSLGQYLTSIKINLEIVKRESPNIDEAHRALLAESSETLERCVQEVRSVSYLLHPPLLDELGLLAALRWYIEGFAERSGIDVQLDAPARFSRLPSEMELALFRIVQESLTNVQRHSRSGRAWVTLTERPDRAEISISDTGVGIPPQTVERITQGKSLEGVGLRGMYERLRELGGRLVIESTASGTTISAALSLQSAQRSRADEDEQGEERKSRTAGKPFQSAELQIQPVAGATNGDGREFRSTGRKRQRASRRPT
jgi:PAS domain S-box-containing protein